MSTGADTVSAERLRGLWKRVGYRFACPASSAVVDVEHLIALSAVSGRDSPDIFWAAASWLSAFGDLVSIHRLSRAVPQGHGHVLGAIVELAVENGGDRRLLQIAQRYRRAETPELLFAVMGQTKAARDYEMDNNLPVFAKWGLQCSSVTLKTDALALRQAVLRDNRTLALRALFGVGVRADVLSVLSDGAKAYIRQIANATGYSYQPVYAEIQHLRRNDIVCSERLGTTALVWLSPAALQLTHRAFA